MILELMAFLISIPALAVILLASILFEHFDCRKTAVFMGLSGLAIAYFLYNIPTMTLIIGLIAYIIIGVVWSFWRYKRHVDEIVEKYKNEPEMNKIWAIKDAAPSKMTSTLVSWLMIWPVSMIALSLSDIINLGYRLVTKVFKSVYAKIYSGAANELGVKI